MAKNSKKTQKINAGGLSITDAASILGRQGGLTITPAKSEAARQNGKLGGRPPGK